MRRFRLLASCLFVSLLSSLAYSQATPPSADTMTLSSMPTKNYGSYTALFAQTGSASSNSYIQFDLATLPASAVVQKATLRLYVNQVSTAGSFDVYQLNTSWNESTLTYDNAPALGSSATGGNPTPFTTASLNQFVLIDITPLVQQWVNGSLTNNGLALATTTSAGAIAFDSKEATLTSHQPELEIVLASTGGGGGVTSWNSRTGAVVPQSGDYSFSLLSGTLEDPQLSGTYMSNVLNFANSGNGYVGTSFIGGTFTGNGSGLTNVPVSAGSPFYIQNGTSQQASSNFNISGNGTAAGTITGTTAVNTHGTYQQGGLTVLTSPNDSNDNTLVGVYAGKSNAGAANTFVGGASGDFNTTGSNNTYVGANAGFVNTTASGNTFVGASAGQSEQSGNNTYVGFQAGVDATGGGNTLVGTTAGWSLQNGTSNILIGNATGYHYPTLGSQDIYIGSNATGDESNTIRLGTPGAGNQTSVYIAGINNMNVSTGSPVYVDANGMLGLGPSGNSGVTSFNGRTGAVLPASGDYSFSLISGTVGSSQLSGTYSNAVTLSNAGNSFTGNGAALTNVPVSSGSPFYIQNGTSQQTGASFDIDGNGMVGGTLTGTTTVNTTGTYQIGGTTVMSTTGTENIFLGVNAGKSGTGQRNAFIGFDTGQTGSGDENTAVGFAAAEANGFTGTRNTILGALAANLLTAGSYNIILGYGAGATLSTGSSNIDVGNAAASASENNTIRIGTQGTQTGEQNSVYIAGITGSTVSSGLPVFVDSTGKLGTAGGLASGVTSFNGRTGAVVPASGDYSFSLISGTLGSSQLSGGYPSASTNPLAGSTNYIQNGTGTQTGASFNIDGDGTVGGTLTGTTDVNTSGAYQIGGSNILSFGSDISTTNVGYDAGNSGIKNTSLGYYSGPSLGGTTENTLLGADAGGGLTTGGQNTFVGFNAGGTAASGNESTLIGNDAGDNITTGGNNIIVGGEAGTNLTTGSNEIIVGTSEEGAAESNTIRIGTTGTQTATYIAGITSQTITGGSPVYINSSGMLGVGSSSGSGVTSFNGRTGAVVPQSGDYSFSLITGTLGSSQLSGTYSSAVTLSNASNSFSGNGAGLIVLNASNLSSGTLPSARLTGTYSSAVAFPNAGNSFTGNGSGLTNVPVSAGSTFYIQNTTSQQSSSNFNISGNGTAGGTLTGTTAINTSGNYQISGINFLSGTSDGKSISLGIGTGAPITGGYNTFVGDSAGAVTTAPSNTFVGALTGEKLTSGTANTFIGYDAGVAATTANYDTFIGQGAGTTVTTGSSDIYIGYAGGGTENNTMRIGTQGTGNGQQSTTFIAGIRGSTASGGIDVLVSSTGQLGTTTSSRRFKDNILDMGDASSKLFQLRPVTFFYKPQYDDGSHILQYGLIAEEVAKVYPDLVAYDKDGQPETVRYHLLTPMLLNEVQKQQKVLTAQQDVIATQQQQIQSQQHEIESLQQRLQRLESLVGNLAAVSTSTHALAAQ